jgi:hypothetical protein
MHIGYWWESQKERDHYEDQDVFGWITLKCILEKWDGAVWTGVITYRRETSGVLLRIWRYTFGFHVFGKS